MALEDDRTPPQTAMDHRIALARLKRARNRVSKQDWATLFRQMQSAATQLAAHPFLKGDAEAEKRLAEMLMAADLEEMDKAVDHLAEYMDGKVAATLIRQGKESPAPRAKRSSVSGQAIGRLGPSGDDFAPEESGSRRARSVIRM